MITDAPDVFVSQVFANGEGVFGFLRNLTPAERPKLAQLREFIRNVVLSDEHDAISWGLEASGQFSVKSLYAKLSSGPKMGYAKPMWAARVPMKVRIFVWQAAADRLPSAINLQRRHGPGNGCSALCGEPKNADHILFLCALLDSCGAMCVRVSG